MRELFRLEYRRDIYKFLFYLDILFFNYASTRRRLLKRHRNFHRSSENLERNCLRFVRDVIIQLRDSTPTQQSYKLQSAGWVMEIIASGIFSTLLAFTLRLTKIMLVILRYLKI